MPAPTWLSPLSVATAPGDMMPLFGVQGHLHSCTRIPTHVHTPLVLSSEEVEVGRSGDQGQS